MGLSDEERTSQIIRTSHKIVDLGRELNDLTSEVIDGSIRKRAQKIHEVCERIPHALYGGSANKCYWFMGGDLEAPVRGHDSPWCSAIIFQCESHRPKDPNDFHFGERGVSFSLMDSFTEEGLLPHAWQKIAYQLYSSLEHLNYALRRYNDKFLRDHEALSEIVSNLSFEMFNIFNSTEDFAKAYVASRIFDDLFSEIKFREPLRLEGEPEDPEVARLREDPMYQLIMNAGASHSIYHCVSSGAKGATLNRMIELDRFRLTMDRTLENRVILLMRIAGRHLNYDHIFRGMLKLLSGKVDEDKLRAEFQECMRASSEHIASERGLYSYSDEAEREAVHGYWRPNTEDSSL